MSVFVYAIVGLILAVSAWFLFGGSSKAAPAPAAAVAPARKPPHAPAPAAHTRATRDKYDPNKSQLAPDRRAGFLAAANWNDPVDVVPGIGPAYAKLLRKQMVGIISIMMLWPCSVRLTPKSLLKRSRRCKSYERPMRYWKPRSRNWSSCCG